MTAHPAMDVLQRDTVPPELAAADARAAGATTVDERWEATAAPTRDGPPPDDLLTAGQRIERYEVEALLGAGGMAVVYRVRHTSLGSLHALKVLTHAAPGVARRLMQEGRVQSSLRHRHVVTVTEGVAAAHQAGLVHRDLKPGNVLTDTSGPALTAKVADFGIAKLHLADRSVALTGTRVALGTPSYVAPEQILDSKRVDARADLFSLEPDHPLIAEAEVVAAGLAGR